MGALRPQIVLFGDSMTEWSFRVDLAGWGASLVNHFARKADVVLRGFGGYNTRLATQFLLDRIFPIPSSYPPTLVTVFFGANDAADPNSSSRNVHVPVEEYNENLQRIVTHVRRQSESTKIVLITPPPVSEKGRIAYQQNLHGKTTSVPTRRNELTKLYADECVKVAQKWNLPVINLWTIFQEDPLWEENYLSDGLHLSAQGNARVFKELLKIIEALPAFRSDRMPWDFPPKRDLGPNPTATLQTWCIRSPIRSKL